MHLGLLLPRAALQLVPLTRPPGDREQYAGLARLVGHVAPPRVEQHPRARPRVRREHDQAGEPRQTPKVDSLGADQRGHARGGCHLLARPAVEVDAVELLPLGVPGVPRHVRTPRLLQAVLVCGVALGTEPLQMRDGGEPGPKALHVVCAIAQSSRGRGAIAQKNDIRHGFVAFTAVAANCPG
eukprot:358717-Pleurochrysis_carterae.AAC.2